MQANPIISTKQLHGFEQLLAGVDIDALDMTPYAKRYLQHIILHKKYYLRIYARLLELVLQTPPAAANPVGGLAATNTKNISLIDYGAGNGILGLLAKHCGFKKVYCNELSADFLHAAKQLAAAMKISLDGFIEGDIEQVKQYFTANTLNVIVSTDVLEHIYSLEHFFATIKEINPAMITVMSTACNPANYFKTREFKMLQVKDELYGGGPGDNTLFGETAMEPFINTRKKIIADFGASQLSPEQVNELAIATRGFRKDDIEKAVGKFISDKIMPVLITHPTNTCDPMTGSWSERLLEFEEYKRIYSHAGFEVKFYDGFYNEYESSFKCKLLFAVNKMIPLTGHRLSPFVILVGKQR
ncbi:MAG TPA: class I SAM-dependent methyltransferase [Ferruginibacter sp.]|nr:class I SAM-dependent methyltransferase [Ferruginibacter sp.]